MAFCEALAERVRHCLARKQGVEEKKMFGGLAFLWHGHMVVGVWKESLIARLGPEQAAAALRQPHVGEFDVTGRAMKGWVVIAPEGVEEDAPLDDWVRQAVGFVATLPAKEPADRGRLFRGVRSE